MTYFDEIYIPIETNGVQTCESYQKLNVTIGKTNVGQKGLYYVAAILLWNNLNETLEISTNLNAF